jgi:hypothetical protein
MLLHQNQGVGMKKGIESLMVRVEIAPEMAKIV